MINVVTLPILLLKDDAPYRDSWSAFDNAKPQAAQTLFNNLAAIVSAGGTLAIHVAKLHEDGGNWIVLDGHLSLDVYRHMGRKDVVTISHDNIRTLADARAAYISFNYLRSTGWLRDSVKTREELVLLGEVQAIQRMADPDLTRDLIGRDDTRWKEFNTVVTTEDEHNPWEAMN